MPVLNPGVTLTVRPPAGTGAVATLVACDAEGHRGLIALTTGSGSLTAGALVLVSLPRPLVTDMDSFMQGQGFQNGAIFGGVEVLLTPFQPAPPAGVAFIVVGQEQQAQLTGFGIGASGPLAASTTYRLSWRVLT